MATTFLQMTECSHSQKAGILHDHLMILHHIQKGHDQLIIFNGNHAVQIFSQIRKNLFSRSLYCRAVRNRVYMGKRNHFSLGKRRFQAGGSCSTPITFMCGFKSFARVETPVASPPPPTGTSM